MAITGDDEKMDVECFFGTYQTEALRFLKEHMDEDTYNLIMQKGGKKKPYVAAKVFLSPSDWKKYVWIEQHGSLDGFGE